MSDDRGLLSPFLVAPKTSHTTATRSTDAAPVLFNEATAPALPQRRCSVCRQHQARYTCPKCQIPYCSVRCYQTHNSNDNENGSACTEDFYKDRVSQVLQLEVEEKKGDMQQILKRIHQEQKRHEEPTASLQPPVAEEERLSQGELVQLLSVLERCEEEGDEKLERLLSSLPPRVRAAVGRALRGGGGDAWSSLQEWILEPWHPWWRTEFVRGSDDSEDDEDDDTTDKEEQQQHEKRTKTLDERILAVPSLETLRPKKAAAAPPPPLQYNLIDILYSTVWMLRLYHGAENACDTMAGEAFHTLLEASGVLSAPETSFCYTSLPGVLSDCTRRSTAAAAGCATDKKATTGECNTPWNVLCQDVALICRNHRRVARALLEASDVVKAAIKTVKKESMGGDGLPKMRRIRKKLEFLLSWFLANQNAVLCLSDDIEHWVDDWDMATASNENKVELRAIQLPEEQSERHREPQQKADSPSLLIKEIDSRKL